jgi:hypothetical protein
VSVWNGVRRLLIEKFSGSHADRTGEGLSVTPGDGDGVQLRLDGETHSLTAEQARALRSALGEALERRREFLHTVGRHRADGAYVVRRRRASSTGHRKVFDTPETLRALYEGLPREFTAEDVETAGLSGGRRHLVVRHLAEHPGFDCALVSRQPLTARKGEDRGDGAG